MKLGLGILKSIVPKTIVDSYTNPAIHFSMEASATDAHVNFAREPMPGR